jgi:hypothetical protein
MRWAHPIEVNRGRGPFARRPLLAAVIALTALATWITLAAAASGVAEPAIISHPAELTNQTSASFTYSDSQAGVTFQCQLDGAGYTACPSAGITYTGLEAGSHSFKVRAVSGTKTSTATVFKWTIDTTAPTTTLTFPVEGGSYGASGWHCPSSSTVGICGKAKDAQGIASVSVSIRQGNGNWWGGSAFDRTSETFNAATLEAPGANTTGWSYSFALPPAGTYTVHVRATDQAGNTTPAASQSSATFTIKTSAPPPPTITSGPEAETTSKSATFAFSDSQPGVTFLCAKDSHTFGNCTSPKTYSTVALGAHTFYVEARDATGNTSAASSYGWSVIKGFGIEGNLAGLLYPGVSQPLHLTVTNPTSKALVVTSLQVSVSPGSTKAGCDGPTNTQVTQSNVSASNTFTVPAKGGKVTLPTGTVSAPQVLMKNLPTNQDACQGASFTFTYSGNGHS